MGQPRWTSTSDQYLNPVAGDAWTADAATRGQQGSQRVLNVETIPAPADIAEHLGVAPGFSIVARRRLILANDLPVEVATSYWPASLAAMTALAQPAKIPGGAVRFVAELGYTPTEVREDVTTRWTTPYEQTTMAMQKPEPALILTRILLDDTGQPYQVDVNVMRAGQHIRYVRQAG
ncbi:UTRA domain-containing protein [Micromonospora sp. WMMA1363]|uniref:UTRA domain-containing protein n=1 Tax=Micromonospora sp. WMMA1363 TaxID=3053985 RepID=UPI00259CB921|nr:UTRA domain-containing protein [Micromonospora sp. WMMA1363]MDM4721178.1 UTRA domain-containing protein [Micromonospora sp. WMMA1363]MDM4723266.1 UTRA domain-containing protein [Micromonospora sp. WMMA1363]